MSHLLVMNIDANAFWERVDSTNPFSSLAHLAKVTDLDYNNIKKQRCLNRIPKASDLYQLSLGLNCSIDFLLTGHEQTRYSQRIERIAKSLSLFATEEDFRLVERILRIPKLAEAKDA